MLYIFIYKIIFNKKKNSISTAIMLILINLLLVFKKIVNVILKKGFLKIVSIYWILNISLLFIKFIH